MKCTFCGKELNDIWVKTTLSSYVERVREDNAIELVENSKITTTETLCTDCFEKFCDVIEQGMKDVRKL